MKTPHCGWGWLLPQQRVPCVALSFKKDGHPERSRTRNLRPAQLKDLLFVQVRKMQILRCAQDAISLLKQMIASVQPRGYRMLMP
jgi:hypothetical protein